METLNRPVEKLYSARTIACATFVGGPLAAGYLIAQNYFQVGDEETGKKSFIYGFTATALLFFLLIFFFDDAVESVPNYLLPAVQAGIVYWLVRRQQGEYFDQHIQLGGRKAPWLKAFGISLLSLVFSLLIVISIQAYKPNELEKITFGRMEHQVFYESDDLDRAQVRKVAHALGDNGFFDTYYRMQVLVEQNKWTYKVLVEADEQAFIDSDIINELKKMQAGLDTANLDRRVQLVLYRYEGEEKIYKNF